MAKHHVPTVPANNVRKLRTEFGLTQKDLATRAGISVYSVRGVENRRRKLGSPLLIRLVAALTEVSAGSRVSTLSFGDVFPNHLEAGCETVSSIRSATSMATSAHTSGQFFVLIAGPFGSPAMVTIRGFSSSSQGACGMPVFNTPAFDFTPTAEKCSGFSICKAN